MTPSVTEREKLMGFVFFIVEYMWKKDCGKTWISIPFKASEKSYASPFIHDKYARAKLIIARLVGFFSLKRIPSILSSFSPLPIQMISRWSISLN